MKIIGGDLKGRNFFMPKGIRPTQNIVRKSLFDILGQDLRDQTMIDLFAGSGAVGLEANSRGAVKTFLVEKEPKNAEVIQENINRLGIAQDEYALINSDVFMTIKNFAGRGERFDIVFADPPFGRELAKKTLKTIEAYDIVHPNSVIIIQHEKREILPEKTGRFLLFRQKKYGNSLLTFYQVSGTS